MSKFVSGLLGAVALVTSLGVAQFAVGHDLSGTSVNVAAVAQSNLVNRSGKADRPSGIAAPSGGTIVTRLSDINDSSMVIRTSLPTLRRDGKVLGKEARRPVACEAPASVLSEIAQRLESGRCVT